jgi:hypothetical protein
VAEYIRNNGLSLRKYYILIKRIQLRKTHLATNKGHSRETDHR